MRVGAFLPSPLLLMSTMAYGHLLSRLHHRRCRGLFGLLFLFFVFWCRRRGGEGGRASAFGAAAAPHRHRWKKRRFWTWPNGVRVGELSFFFPRCGFRHGTVLLLCCRMGTVGQASEVGGAAWVGGGHHRRRRPYRFLFQRGFRLWIDFAIPWGLWVLSFRCLFRPLLFGGEWHRRRRRRGWIDGGAPLFWGCGVVVDVAVWRCRGGAFLSQRGDERGGVGGRNAVWRRGQKRLPLRRSSAHHCSMLSGRLLPLFFRGIGGGGGDLPLLPFPPFIGGNGNPPHTSRFQHVQIQP